MIRLAKPTKLAALALVGATLASVPTASYARNNTGAAIAAGVVGGLLIGGIAAAAASDYNNTNYYYAPPPPPPPPPPRYGYGGGYGGGYGPRYVPAYGPGYRPHRPRCWTETQTYYNRWGYPRAREVEVCR